jgi:tryptophanyl-tRNA synthetase
MVQRVLSCIQPTAEMHIGNYFGAVKNWVDLQDSHECIYGIVDLHAITMPYDPTELRVNTERMVVALLACGIDPRKSTLFIQSLVPEHAELCWILGCLCPFGELSRMTQFKEKSQQLESGKSDQFVSAGLFTYPVLQAADILIYRADFVPVGKDQEQHLELSRVLARRFNRDFGLTFPEPRPLFTETPKLMSLADPEQKMSKSLGSRHYIGLFEEPDSIRAKIKIAVTDSGVLPPGVEMSPGVTNLFEILKACGKMDQVNELLDDYKAGKRQYSGLKEVVTDALLELTGRLRERQQYFLQNVAEVNKQVKEMSERARDIAKQTLKDVRQLSGFPERE